MSSSVRVNRSTFRILLVALLILSGAFATWSWLRPYEWSADKAARCQIVGCQVVRDHSNYWVNLKLEVGAGVEHDLEQPIRLLLADDRELEPADTTLEGDKQKKIRMIWLKFWLEKDDFKGPLRLKINDGTLSVRAGGGEPKLRSDGSRYFVTRNW